MADAAPASSPRRLLLLRHARAVAAADPDGQADDHARDLSERGGRDAAALGDEMRRLGMRPELALVSGALRTRRTWEMLGPFDPPGPALEIDDRLYLAEADVLLAALRDIPDRIVTALLIGHNPGLQELADHFAGDAAGLRAGMPTCTLVEFEVAGTWSDLRPQSVRQTRMLRG